jgi:hypothetical protein
MELPPWDEVGYWDSPVVSSIILDNTVKRIVGYNARRVALFLSPGNQNAISLAPEGFLTPQQVSGIIPNSSTGSIWVVELSYRIHGNIVQAAWEGTCQPALKTCTVGIIEVVLNGTWPCATRDR